jgi:aryl-alcohol dehydrogenase-like predicted oxidoreductase
MCTKVVERQLGKTGPKVSSIVFGTMGSSSFYVPPAPDEERFKVVDRAIEVVSTYIDSADIYGDKFHFFFD